MGYLIFSTWAKKVKADPLNQLNRSKFNDFRFLALFNIFSQNGRMMTEVDTPHPHPIFTVHDWHRLVVQIASS
jgi:hypothetical protein